jgi:hypothetical protein
VQMLDVAITQAPQKFYTVYKLCTSEAEQQMNSKN